MGALKRLTIESIIIRFRHFVPGNRYQWADTGHELSTNQICGLKKECGISMQWTTIVAGFEALRKVGIEIIGHRNWQ